jgi:hypothetical protein
MSEREVELEKYKKVLETIALNLEGSTLDMTWQQMESKLGCIKAIVNDVLRDKDDEPVV